MTARTRTFAVLAIGALAMVMIAVISVGRLPNREKQFSDAYQQCKTTCTDLHAATWLHAPALGCSCGGPLP